MASDTKNTARAKAVARWRLATSRAAAQGESPFRYALRALLRRVFPRRLVFSEADRRGFPLVSLILFAPDSPDDGGARLEASARSALDRTYDPFELIIVGHPAGGAIAPALPRLAVNPWVRMVGPEPSRPESRLMSALLAARGELVTWTSVDYLLDPTAIAALVEALMSHPKAGFVHTDIGSSIVEREGAVLPTWALYGRATAIALAHDLDVELAGPSAAAADSWAPARHLPEEGPLCTRRPLASPERGAEAHHARSDRAERTVAYDATLGAADRADLVAAAEKRSVRLIGMTNAVAPGPSIRAVTDAWQLAWRSPRGHHALTFWRGLVIGPSVRAARGRRRRLAAAGSRPVVGCHLDLGAFPADVDAARGIIAKSPTVFFAFVDASDDPQSEAGAKLVARLENAAYLGRRPFGEAAELYSSLSAIWLPPRLAKPGEGDVDGPYRRSLALAYAIGRPFVGPRSLRFIPAPWQYFYHPDESLGFITAFDRVSHDPILLDAYLERWTPARCLDDLLDDAVALIDTPSPAVPAVRRPASPAGASRVLIAADALDTGGLEEMIAQLALHLRRRGAEVAVAAVKKGGVTASRLRDQGVRVYVANGDRRVLRDVLARERPDVVSSHLAGLKMLQEAADRGVPVVETVHNTYVWFDRMMWHTETLRCRTFTHAAAVSGLVRAYYAKWNPGFPADWTQVVPNGIDVDRLPPVDRTQARQALGIAPDEVVFLSLASYVPQKNQYGLLTAFDETARRRPRARLLCVGKPIDPVYYDRLLRHRRGLGAEKQIELQAFRDDVALLLSAADALVLDSFFEGWSVAANEALVAGLPVIHSECGSARELVGDGANGILIPNPAVDPLDLTWKDLSRALFLREQRNTTALVEAMTRVVDERDEWRRRAPEIAARARGALSFERTVLGYEALFGAVVNGSA